MSEKEFRRLKRVELVEIIYQLEQELANVKRENELLHEQLEAKISELENVGSIDQVIARLSQICEAMGRKEEHQQNDEDIIEVEDREADGKDTENTETEK